MPFQEAPAAKVTHPPGGGDEVAPTSLRPSVNPGSDPGLFDYALMGDYAGFVFRAPGRHKIFAITAFLIVAGLGFIASWALPKTYHVETSILAQRNQVMAYVSNPGLARIEDNDTPTRAAKETILRWDNLVALANQTGLVDRYKETLSPAGQLREWVQKQLARVIHRRQLTKEEETEAMAYTLEKKISVTVGDGLVTIAVDWSDPDIAYQLTDAAQQSFLETRHTTEIAILGDAIAVLESHAQEFQRDINANIQEIGNRERNARPPRPQPRPQPLPVIANEPPPVQPVRQRPVVQGPSAQELELTRVQGLLANKRRALADLEEFRQRRLADLQAQLVQQQAIYADEHPAVMTIRQSIEALSRPSQQMESLRSEVQELEQQVARQSAQFAAAEPEAAEAHAEARAEVPRIVRMPRVEAAPVETPADAADRLEVEYLRGKLRMLYDKYGSVVDRIDSAKVEMDTARAAFKYRYSVITPPQFPREPKKPKPGMLLAAGILGGIFFAFFVATAVDIHSGKILAPWQIERKLGLPVLARIKS